MLFISAIKINSEDPTFIVMIQSQDANMRKINTVMGEG